jgi:hypothetical protein
VAGIQINQAPRSRFDAPIGGNTDPTRSFGNPNSFTSAADQQAGDYDKIMGMYGDIYNKNNNNPLRAQSVGISSIAPQLTQYSRSADVGSALSNLKDLSETGGYSTQGIADLRARGISPIRSIYGTAQRNLDRSRALSGGYSPNYGAVSAKMARDEASSIGNAISNVNAGIAQNVASNRLSAAPNYASAAEGENAARTASEQKNADVINQINEYNANNSLDTQKFNSSQNLAAQTGQRNSQLGAVEGMRSLYGTTPALTNTFGNQVVQAAQLGQGQQQINSQRQNAVNNSILQPRFRNG